MFFREHHRPSENLGFPYCPNKVVGSIITSFNQMEEVGMISKNASQKLTNQQKIQEKCNTSRSWNQLKATRNLHPQSVKDLVV